MPEPNKLTSFKDLYKVTSQERAKPPADSQQTAAVLRMPAPDSQPASDSLSPPDSQPPPDSLPADNSLVRETTAYHPGSQPVPDSLPAPDIQSPDLWSPFRDKRGHLRLPNAAVDGLYSLLDPYEQAIFTQLFRLSHGYGKPTCKIGLPQLARRANVGKTATQATVNRLIQKGLVRKLEYEIGRNKEQGTTYWVSSPDSLPVAGSLPGGDTIKVKALKDSSKSGAHARRDYSACPDCRGTGMWYPEGYGKGVARCGHVRLKGTREK